jgi:alanine racemase
VDPRAWIEIDGDALAHNAHVLRRAIPDATRLGILVKANGYGHGMTVAARAALDGGADQLLVATLDEGLALRQAETTAAILVVYPVPPDGIGEAIAANLEVSVGGLQSARRTLDAAAAAGGSLRLHVEIDSGMGRGGVFPADLPAVLRWIDATPDATLVGIWSHLADGADPDRSRAQIARYEAALADVAATGRRLPLRHVAASEGLFLETAPAYDLVRIGIAFYGTIGLDMTPTPAMAALAADLRPAMTVAARPVRLEAVPAGTPIGYGSEWTTTRPSRIATLPIGYADGWARHSWPGGEALVRARRVPLVGRVSMDSVCVDVTDVPEATADDPFVLLGAQGAERITVDEVARLRRTIPNEVFCALGPRLARRGRGG